MTCRRWTTRSCAAAQPTLHREFGEDLAILSAVALLNHAYGLVAKNHAALNPRQWPMLQVIKRVVDAVGWDGTIAGEAVDLHSEGSNLDFDTLEFIHSRKTGALFVAAAAVGGMLANMSPAALGRIEVFAKNLGLAFQITDDILDVVGNPEQLGKDVGKDADRLTFVKLAGVDGAKKLSDELVETSLSSISNLGPAAGSRCAMTARRSFATAEPLRRRNESRGPDDLQPCSGVVLSALFSPRPPRAQVAQLVEQRTENPRVGGSIPSLGTKVASEACGQTKHDNRKQCAGASIDS